MKLGTYGVRVTQGQHTASLPGAFVVKPCRSYTVSWTINSSLRQHFVTWNGNHVSDSASAVSFGGGVEIRELANGARTVSPSGSGSSGAYVSDYRADIHLNRDCGGPTVSWSLPGNRWEEHHAKMTFVPTSAFLASLSSISVSEQAGGTVSFNWALQMTGTNFAEYRDAYGGDYCTPYYLGDGERTYTLTGDFSPNLGNCGLPPIVLSPVGDGRTFTFSAQRMEGDGVISWATYGCSITVVKN